MDRQLISAALDTHHESKRPHCPGCASDDVARIGKLPDNNLFAGAFLDHVLLGGLLYRCGDCRLKFRYPVEDAAVYEALYDNQGTTSWPTDTERPDWSRITRYIAELCKRGRVLDFGCYTGGLLARLGDSFERFGVEINRAAGVIASEYAGCRVYASIDEIPAALRFDVVIACDVVEHMINPADIVERLVSLLSDDGILVLTTADGDNRLWNRFGANWWYCYYPEHVSFISRAWLDRVAAGLGVSLHCCETFHYASLSPAARPIHVALTYFYGWFPNTYLTLRRFLDKIRGRPGVSSVTGVGVSDDHLLVVLGKSVRST